MSASSGTTPTITLTPFWSRPRPYRHLTYNPHLSADYKRQMMQAIDACAAQAARGPVPYARPVIHTEVLTNHGWVRVK